MRTDILGVKVDNNTINEAVEMAIDAVDKGSKFVIFTPNPEIVMKAYEDSSFKKILNSADIVTPDGIGIVYASKILKGFVKERAAGFDICCGIIDRLNSRGGSVYLLGGKPGVAEQAGEKLKESYKNLIIAGTHDGYFNNDLEIICEINEKSPDLVLVCLGFPKQEKWIYDNRDKLNAKVMIGAGGSIDVIAGNVKRAPDIFIKLGLEWFYRLVSDPKRIGRMVKLPVFMIKVMMHGEKNQNRI